MFAPPTRMMLLSGLVATASSNHLGAGGGAPSSGANGPCVAAIENISVSVSGSTPAIGGRVGTSDINATPGGEWSCRSRTGQSSSLHSHRLCEPLKPGSVRMTTRQPCLLPRSIGITDRRQDVELAIILKREPPHRSAQAGNRENVVERL